MTNQWPSLQHDWATWCGPELTAAKWDFKNHTVTAWEEIEPCTGNRHERRKTKAIERSLKNRRQKGASR